MNMSSLRLTTVVSLALVALMPAFGTPAVFDFATSAQGWIAPEGGGVANFAAGGGAVTFDYVTPTGPFDPILQSPPGLTVNAATEHWLRVDVEITTPAAAPDQTFQVFYDDGAGFNEGDSRTFTVTPNAGVQTVILDLAVLQPGRTDFSGTVTMFRIDPGTSEADLVGGSARVELIALTDNADMDALVDDVEIAIFGDITTSNGYTDTDGDGIIDRIEISLGLDPLVDEGVTVPLGGTAAALIGIAVLGAWAMRRR